ncbi:hypothetical protein SAMN05444162_1340 [Paenibacillaceae bacterium GAS479]|nr:hypothetical protein SAMN05444162_1340 [Paenibacillaceae bacterium GAS479]
MKKLVPIAILLLLIVSLLFNQFAEPLSDFWVGLVTGLIITGIIYSLATRFWVRT